jgi:transposase
VKKLREAWAELIQSISPHQLLFIDESGASTSMTRTHGRAEPGVRVEGAVPGAHWKVTTMIGAMRLEGMAVLSSIEAATDGEIFLSFVNEALVPTLNEGDVVVMDNLSAHTSANVRLAIEGAGAKLLLLPPYSPDLNPIEKAWSKVKQFLRSAQARSSEALGQAITQALETITQEDIRHWFAHCGYPPATGA